MHNVDLDCNIRGLDRDWSEGAVVNGDVASVLTLNTIRPVTGVPLTAVEVVDVNLVDILYLD